jgi:hypothetical protein
MDQCKHLLLHKIENYVSINVFFFKFDIEPLNFLLSIQLFIFEIIALKNLVLAEVLQNFCLSLLYLLFTISIVVSHEPISLYTTHR